MVRHIFQKIPGTTSAFRLRKFLDGAGRGRTSDAALMVDGCDSQKKVLIVEDDPDTRDVVRMLLEHAGYPVVTAANGEEALTYLKNNEHPCLILLDMIMPLMNGRQLLAALRNSDTLAPLPVVVVSATPEEAVENGKLTAQGFVRKPVDFDVLLKFVSTYC